MLSSGFARKSGPTCSVRTLSTSLVVRRRQRVFNRRATNHQIPNHGHPWIQNFQSIATVMLTNVTTVTVLSGPERRRRWGTTEKLRIVEESLAPAARVVEVARRYDIQPNLLTLWWRQARNGALGCGSDSAIRQADKVHFAAVSVAPDQQALMAPSERRGAIEIEFAAGVRMRITGEVDSATLTAAVAALSGGRPR